MVNGREQTFFVHNKGFGDKVKLSRVSTAYAAHSDNTTHRPQVGGLQLKTGRRGAGDGPDRLPAVTVALFTRTLDPLDPSLVEGENNRATLAYSRRSRLIA